MASPWTASRLGRPLARPICCARTVVKVAGMCCAMTIGAEQSAGNALSKVRRACGPPVELPIARILGSRTSAQRNAGADEPALRVVKADVATVPRRLRRLLLPHAKQ